MAHQHRFLFCYKLTNEVCQTIAPRDRPTRVASHDTEIKEHADKVFLQNLVLANSGMRTIHALLPDLSDLPNQPFGRIALYMPRVDETCLLCKVGNGIMDLWWLLPPGEALCHRAS